MEDNRQSASVVNEDAQDFFKLQDYKRIQFLKSIEQRSNQEEVFIQVDPSSEQNTSHQHTGLYDFLKLSNSKGSVSRMSENRASKGQESSIDEQVHLEPNFGMAMVGERLPAASSPPGQQLTHQHSSKIFEQYRDSRINPQHGFDSNKVSLRAILHPQKTASMPSSSPSISVINKLQHQLTWTSNNDVKVQANNTTEMNPISENSDMLLSESGQASPQGLAEVDLPNPLKNSRGDEISQNQRTFLNSFLTQRTHLSIMAPA